jgi:hypothetical protein
MRLSVVDWDDACLLFALARDLPRRKQRAQNAGRQGHNQQRGFNCSPHWGSKPYQSSQAGSVRASITSAITKESGQSAVADTGTSKGRYCVHQPKPVGGRNRRRIANRPIRNSTGSRSRPAGKYFRVRRVRRHSWRRDRRDETGPAAGTIRHRRSNGWRARCRSAERLSLREALVRM